ncbi:hypothetical protein D5366_09150 [Neokomagataea tanensis]|uniref:Lectin-like protein BA14k n=1 Tax=Neokomagataea tanensis TaxID=661191 RepID=A0A4Y6V9K5_9PROT|nr:MULTISPECIES: hypothetical protein [Neokomagataea]QDH25350.1 hypothetical protein D5366_09150 [Neokomagataea tanensis]
MRLFWVSFALLPLLAACADEQPAAPATQQKIPPQDFAPGMVTGSEPLPDANTVQNDPSAPVTTPLCGTAAKESNQAAAIVYPQPKALPSSCPRNACFDPLTGTFIAATGQRSVCR